MRPQVRSTRRRSARTSLAPQPLPKNFVCVDPEEATQLFDYLNGAAEGVDKEAAAIHLRLCFNCQDAVARLKNIDKDDLLETERWPDALELQ